MAWSDIQNTFTKLRNAAEAGNSLEEPWRVFAKTVQETEASAPPYHLRRFFKILERTAKGRSRDELAILEHGCGSGMTQLYLLALGYTKIYGVDLGGPLEIWNGLLADAFGIRDKRFFAYTGEILPLDDASIDVVFSEQVLEHVAPPVVEAFYREEGRVLKPGGIAYHLVPHRLVPYDSHTQTWFVHWLPRPAQRWVYDLLGHDPDYVMGMLHLRSPSFHRKHLTRYIGPFEDMTASRLAEPVDPTYYDASLRLRNLIRKGATLPLAGILARAIFRNFVMLETVAVKR